MTSPYAPGAGVAPPLLAGRDGVRARATEMCARTANFGSPGRSPLILTGVRGVGKTVTLRAVTDDAADHGFVVVRTTVDRHGSLTSRIAAGVAESLAPLQPASGQRWKAWKSRLSRLSVEVSVPGVAKVQRPAAGTTPPEPVDHRDELIALLDDSAQLVKQQQRPGLCLAIDEIQEGPAVDLAAVTAVAQELVGAPLVIIGAGLPNTPDRLMSAGSYAERFQYQVLGPLPPPDAAAALLIPATARAVTWNQDAAELVLSRAAGAPYLIQLYADAAWRAAAPPVGGHIDLGHARSGIAIATQELHSGLFRGRWNKASALEQQYLAAIARHLDTGGSASTATVAAALGRTTSQLGYIRTRLLDKGLIQPAGHGRVAFSLPGFEHFVTEEADAQP